MEWYEILTNFISNFGFPIAVICSGIATKNENSTRQKCNSLEKLISRKHRL